MGHPLAPKHPVLPKEGPQDLPRRLSHILDCSPSPSKSTLHPSLPHLQSSSHYCPTQTPAEKLAKPAGGKEHIQMQKMYITKFGGFVLFRFVLTQERAFIIFNSLPRKLIFKTLLWSLSIPCATFRDNDPTQRLSDGVSTGNEAGPAFELCERGACPWNPYPPRPQCREAQGKRADP